MSPQQSANDSSEGLFALMEAASTKLGDLMEKDPRLASAVLQTLLGKYPALKDVKVNKDSYLEGIGKGTLGWYTVS